MRVSVLFSIVLILIPSLAHTQELPYEDAQPALTPQSDRGDIQFNGKIVEQPVYRFLKEDYLLNPDSKIIDFSEWRNRFYGDIGLNLNHENIKFISKFRPTILSDEETTDVDNIVDDAYLDIMFGDGRFFYFGKRNIRDGVGLSTNPTDFLGEEKEVDVTKREEERRLEREGNLLAGVDLFYKDITLTAIFAPRIKDLQKERDRVLLRANLFMESINTDMSLHYFNGTIPGAGINISSTIGEALILYTETAFRWGSTRKEVKLLQEGLPNIYEINDPDDNEKVYPHTVAGGHYTFKNGTNIISEYIYNGDGYSNEEWMELTGFIKYSNEEYKKGFLTDLMRLNLLQANGMMKFRQMRKNYIFVRISNPDIGEKIDGAMVLFLNADDESFVINPSIDYRIKTDTTVGITALVFSGEDNAEFGMPPWDSEISMTFKYFF